MRRWVVAVFLTLAIPCAVYALRSHQMVVARKNVAVGGPTDFTADANCEGAWYMNAGGTTNETDRSSAGNDADVLGANSLPSSTNRPAGYSGYSRDSEVDDVDKLYTINGIPEVNGSAQAFSVVGWVMAEEFQGFTARGGVGQHDNGNDTNVSWGMSYRSFDGTTSDAGIRFILSTNGSTTAAKTVDYTTEYITTGSWAHAAATYDTTNVILFANGNPVVTSAWANGSHNGTGQIKLNGASRHDETDGLIDEVAIFSRALSASEIGSIYSNGLDGTKGGND
ncbi:MAG: LamG domain-containing protein [Gammaproteobacteria bacterium]|nr:LamG domain-containing protein [Gammaproteobacteria bacterium]MDH3375906.1 LamG domain-containing protein [Gammaproteobacteria bacterium]